MNNPLRLGIAGLGTVGIGVLKILKQQSALLSIRTGREISITAVSAQSRNKDRGISIASFAWEDDPITLATRDDIDVFVELIGGTDGTAKTATEAAIAAGKHVVTANKAMLAIHGQALAEAAEMNKVSLRFEAAVAGGIPVIKALTEGLAGNTINRIMGVMNGSCNYILTRMESAGLTYAEVFAEAKELGYLEADPQLDVGGIDAAHKLAILSTIAFGTRINFDGIELEGIERISIEDIRHSADMGYKIKLLGVSQKTDRGLEQRMMPCLVPDSSPFAQLQGGTNMVAIEGDAVEQIALRGPGAGEGPTASAVLADICDIARGHLMPVFGQPANTLTKSPSAKSVMSAPYYLRMTIDDKPGALAKITTIIGDAGVSIDRMRQYGHANSSAPVLIVTHNCTRTAMDEALSAIKNTDVLGSDPVVLRIEAV